MCLIKGNLIIMVLYFQRVSYLTVPLRSKLFAFTNGSISQLNVHSQNTRARNRTVECFHDKCLPVMILHLGTIEFSQYYVEVLTNFYFFIDNIIVVNLSVLKIKINKITIYIITVIPSKYTLKLKFHYRL